MSLLWSALLMLLFVWYGGTIAAAYIQEMGVLTLPSSIAHDP